MSIVNEKNFQQIKHSIKGNAQAALEGSMMSQINNIAIIGYDAAIACLCSSSSVD
jgi:hypothetical protein